MKLTTKISLVALLIAFCVGSLSSYFIFSRTNNLLLSNQKQAQLLAAKQLNAAIDQTLYNAFLDIKLISGSVPIKNLINNESVTLAEVRQRVDEFMILSGPWYELSFYNAQGQKVYSSTLQKNGSSIEVLSDAEQLAIKQALQGAAAYSDVFIRSSDGKPTMIFTAPIISGEKIIGVAVGYYAWPVVAEKFDTSGYDHVYLSNKAGYLIAGSGYDASDKTLKVQINSQLVNSAGVNAVNQVQVGALQGQTGKYLVSIAASSGYLSYLGNGWVVILETPISEIRVPIFGIGVEQLINIILITLLGMVIVYVAAFWFVIKPIKELTSGAESILGGNLSVKLVSKSKDEIGQLFRTFNDMVAKLRESYATMEANVRSKTKALAATAEKLKSNNLELEQTKKATLNVLEDITEEKKMSDQLAHELEKFRLAVENANDQVVITDPEGIILFANQGTEKITGFSIREMLGKKAGGKELWGGLMEEKFYQQLWKRIKIEKKPFVGEIENKKKNGLHYFALSSINPILDEKGEVTFFVAIERDVTIERQIDKAKTEFVSLASHQLRTPLSAINWYAEMLLAGDAGKLNKEQGQYIQEIYAGNQRMVDLVNALLNVSRIDLGTFAIEPELTDFCAIAESVLAELKPQIQEKRMKVSSECDPKLPKIMADPKLIRIVIQNLLTNALKYSPAGKQVKISLLKKDKNINIIVKDAGYGIPENAKAKIFEKLYRADNVREKDVEGTGLGLYIVKAIVEGSKGKIWFDSVENKGSTFYVTLPLSGMKKKEGTKELTAIK